MPVTINGNGLIGGLADIKVPDGTASAPTISNIDDLNTGIFFPAEDTIAFSEGGTEVMRINSSGNVGIGTSSPASLLHADGGLFTGQRYANSGALVLRRANGNAATPTAVSAADSVSIIVGRAYDGVSTYRDVASIAFFASQNTTASQSGGYISLATTPDGSTSTIERMRIDNAGNVGIGTTSPVGNVDVYNATTTTLYVRGDGSVDTLLRRASANASSPGFYFQKARGTLESPTIVSAGDVAGQLFFQAHDGTAFRSLAVINGVVDTTPGASDMPGRLEFYTTADGASTSTERMRIDSSGNVGIGGNPAESAARLTLYSTNAFGGMWFKNSRNGVDHTGIFFDSSRGTPSTPTVLQAEDAISNIVFRGYDGSTYQNAAIIIGQVDGTPGAGDMPGRLTFWTTADGSATSTERMRITSAGNVGIGTSSPGGRLHVQASDSSVTTYVMQSIAETNRINMRRANGTTSSPTGVGNGDWLGYVDFSGYDGSAYQVAARIRGSVDATPGTGDMPGGLSISLTADGGTTLTERMYINNAGLITGTGTSLGAWTAYTPTLGGTGWAIGNGTIAGAYCQIGKVIMFRITCTLGSTSTFGSAPATLTVPSAMAAQAQNVTGFNVQLLDTSTGVMYIGGARNVSTTEMGLYYANGSYTSVISTNPFTWASTDIIRVTGYYDAS